MKISIKILLLGVLGINLISCVSLKPANNYNQAENKIRKFNTGIQNQLERYPKLADIAYKSVIKDTVYISGYSTSFTAPIIDTDSLIKLTNEYDEWLKQRQYTIDSLLTIPLPTYHPNCSMVVKELKNRIDFINRQYQDQKDQVLFYTEKYNSVVNKSIKGVYEDSLFIVNYKYSNGDILIQPKIKDRFIIRDKTNIGYDIDIRKNFWQDIKFWGFLIILISIFYFFNNLVYNLINFIFITIRTFVRKLFTKI